MKTGAFVGVLIAVVVVGLIARPWPRPASAEPDAPSLSASHTAQVAEADLPEGYIGVEACGACHPDQFETASQTPHHLASRIASADSIAGHFAPDAATMMTANPNLLFQMTARRDGFYQTSLEGRLPVVRAHSERFDFVLGSGRKGQSYISWKDDRLFQLPVSYWTELDTWINSPGYPDGEAIFDRPIPPHCLECHATHVEALELETNGNRYSRNGFMLGITCEKCHGPGGEHLSSPDGPSAANITNPATLSRDRQIDNCARCHTGFNRLVAPAFSYRPGEPLSEYVEIAQPEPDAPLDVHGNQLALLERSQCYINTDMTCSTCHDVHRVQRDVADMSERCATCHTVDSCGVFPQAGAQIADSCVECHLPNQRSEFLVASTDGRTVAPKIRNHWIKIYPAESRELLDELVRP